ncbi:WecB/TagA/CpsF family glycosyltransferase [Nocardioides acrostichi]|uniref:WecB/TagA/CpsF family glycosyltransferase n=1 Tax=Nocardioides acrostichi TaxID=2784339 RepID=A0A930YBI9_9ACTN|nr:WecB/TagA/CpsF family glycosyltransferase [Nocardioides acrostichi]MBF4162518.1 WecB/TagA/CpsF family glycosyltransferase [Nocardioides acrostichi]
MPGYFCDVPVFVGDPDSAVRLVIDKDAPNTFRLINSGTFYSASSDPAYWTILQARGINLPDGSPLAWYLRRKGYKETQQVRGPWLFEACMDRGQLESVRHFLLGTTDETLEQLAQKLSEKYPDAKIVGTHAPPFGEMTSESRSAQDLLIERTAPDIVWVALGTPKQDREAGRIHERLGVTTVAVGAAFDFSAGTKRPAPNLLIALHLEWLFRLISEPRRLWRRYLIGNSTFLMLMVRDIRKWKR